jgi:hypothetical protein
MWTKRTAKSSGKSVMNAADIDRINKEKDERLKLAQQAASEANNTSRTTSGQLLLIAGAILTFSASVISSNTIITHLSWGWRHILIVSWAIFALSALFGLLGLFIDYYFFRRWNTYQFSVAEELTKGTPSPTKIKDTLSKLDSKKPASSSPLWPLIIQTLLIIVGVIMFLLVISHAVLN